MPSDLYTRIAQTANDFAHSYDQDKCSESFTCLSAQLTPTCRRYFGPSSLLSQAPALANGQSNAEFEAQTQQELTNLFTTWTVEVQDVTVDIEAKKAVVRAINTSTSRRGKVYAFDNTFTLWMTEDGGKVEKIVQIVDVGAAGQLMMDERAMAEALQ